MPEKTPKIDPEQIDWLSEVFRSIVREKHRDLTLRQLAVLLLIQHFAEPPTVKDLANQLEIPRSAMTRAIDRLEEFELAERQPSLVDGRQVTLHLSKNGVAYIKRIKDWAKVHSGSADRT